MKKLFLVAFAFFSVHSSFCGESETAEQFLASIADKPKIEQLQLCMERFKALPDDEVETSAVFSHAVNLAVHLSTTAATLALRTQANKELSLQFSDEAYRVLGTLFEGLVPTEKQVAYMRARQPILFVDPVHLMSSSFEILYKCLDRGTAKKDVQRRVLAIMDQYVVSLDKAGASESIKSRVRMYRGLLYWARHENDEGSDKALCIKEASRLLLEAESDKVLNAESPSVLPGFIAPALADIMYTSNDYNNALAWAEKAAKATEPGAKVHGLQLCAVMYSKLERYSDAYKAFNAIISLGRKDPKVIHSIKASVLHARAQAALKLAKGNDRAAIYRQRAVDDLSTVINDEASWSSCSQVLRCKVVRLLGEIFKDTGQYENALRYFAQLKDAQANSPLVVQLRVALDCAECYSRLGKEEDVIAVLSPFVGNEALNNNPLRADMHARLGIAYLCTEDLDSALTSFQYAIDHKDDLDSCSASAACMFLAQVYARQKKCSDALAMYSKAIGLDEHSVVADQARIGKAMVLFEQQKCQEGLSLIEQLAKRKDWKTNSVTIQAQIMKALFQLTLGQKPTPLYLSAIDNYKKVAPSGITAAVVFYMQALGTKDEEKRKQLFAQAQEQDDKDGIVEKAIIRLHKEEQQAPLKAWAEKHEAQQRKNIEENKLEDRVSEASRQLQERNYQQVISILEPYLSGSAENALMAQAQAIASLASLEVGDNELYVDASRTEFYEPYLSGGCLGFIRLVQAKAVEESDPGRALDLYLEAFDHSSAETPGLRKWAASQAMQLFKQQSCNSVEDALAKLERLVDGPGSVKYDARACYLMLLGRLDYRACATRVKSDARLADYYDSVQRLAPEEVQEMMLPLKLEYEATAWTRLPKLKALAAKQENNHLVVWAQLELALAYLTPGSRSYNEDAGKMLLQSEEVKGFLERMIVHQEAQVFDINEKKEEAWSVSDNNALSKAVAVQRGRLKDLKSVQGFIARG